MFPISYKWIDGIYEKIESTRAQVDDFVRKEDDSKYVDGLKTVGNNVMQFCSTMDPLKYVEDQLTNFGTKIDELYSCIVPYSVDSMLSTAYKTSELNDCKSDNDDIKVESVTCVEKTELVASAGKSQNPKLDVEDNISRTDQYPDEDSPPIYNEFGIDEDENNVDVIQSPKKRQLDESCIFIDKNDWFVSEASVDTKPPEIKLPSTSTLKHRLIRHCQQLKNKSKSIISEEPSTNKDQSLSPSMSSSNNDTWESEWEII